MTAAVIHVCGVLVTEEGIASAVRWLFAQGVDGRSDGVGCDQGAVFTRRPEDGLKVGDAVGDGDAERLGPESSAFEDARLDVRDDEVASPGNQSAHLSERVTPLLDHSPTSAPDGSTDGAA